ncbi:MAG: hypothetical protein ACFFD2_29845 [Promethearchaeota archaeon]
MLQVSFFKKEKQLTDNLNSWDQNTEVTIIDYRNEDGIAAITVSNQALNHLGFIKYFKRLRK